jgi:hypothetical protein
MVERGDASGEERVKPWSSRREVLDLRTVS